MYLEFLILLFTSITTVEVFWLKQAQDKKKQDRAPKKASNHPLFGSPIAEEYKLNENVQKYFFVTVKLKLLVG